MFALKPYNLVSVEVRRGGGVGNIAYPFLTRSCSLTVGTRHIPYVPAAMGLRAIHNPRS